VVQVTVTYIQKNKSSQKFLQRTIRVDIVYMFMIIWCWKTREYLAMCQKTFNLSSVVQLKLKQKQKTKGEGGVESDKI